MTSVCLHDPSSVRNPRDCVHCLRRDLATRDRELAEARAELEQERTRLAGCGAAALGYIDGACLARPGDYGWSASYGDVLKLRREYAEARADIVAAVNLVLARGCKACLRAEHPYWHPAGTPCPLPATTISALPPPLPASPTGETRDERALLRDWTRRCGLGHIRSTPETYRELLSLVRFVIQRLSPAAATSGTHDDGDLNTADSGTGSIPEEAPPPGTLPPPSSAPGGAPGVETACGMLRVSPGEHGEGEERPCTNPSVGVTEDGVRACVGCAKQMESEGFRVDYDQTPPSTETPAGGPSAPTTGGRGRG